MYGISGQAAGGTRAGARLARSFVIMPTVHAGQSAGCDGS